MRRVARENLFKLVFEYTFYGTANDQTLELMLQGSDLTEDDRNFINGCYFGIVTREDELKKMIEEHLEGYRIERVYRPTMRFFFLRRTNFSNTLRPTP